VGGSVMWPAHTHVSAVDAQSRVASSSLPTTPTDFIFPTKVSQQGGIDYDPATGIFTFSESGLFMHNMYFNIVAAQNRTIYASAQIDTGSGFVLSRWSGRRNSVTANTDGLTNFSSVNPFAAGTRLKFQIWASGACTIQSTDLPGVDAGTLTVPAARVMYGSVTD
jgi:hypothetical protein